MINILESKSKPTSKKYQHHKKINLRKIKASHHSMKALAPCQGY
jgi:hypothetical protein